MIRHELLMFKGEYVWEPFFSLWPRIIQTARTNQDGHAQVYETFIWLERMERRVDKTKIPFFVYEYRLIEKDRP